MKRLFISQPMNGKTDEEIRTERERIIQKMKEIFPDVVVINSYFQNYDPDCGVVPLKYLAKSIGLLATADIAYFAEGWAKASGCRIENMCCVSYGINTIEE